MTAMLTRVAAGSPRWVRRLWCTQEPKERTGEQTAEQPRPDPRWRRFEQTRLAVVTGSGMEAAEKAL